MEFELPFRASGRGAWLLFFQAAKHQIWGFGTRRTIHLFEHGYVTISRGRKGVKVFTADKEMLRENIARGGARTLAMDMAQSSVHTLAAIWGRGVAYVLNVQESQRKSAERQAEALRQRDAAAQSESRQQSESIKPVEPIKPTVKKSETIRRRMEIPQQQTQQKSKGMRI